MLTDELTIQDILEGGVTPPQTAVFHHDPVAERRMQLWRNACAAGNQSLFERRLRRDGLNNQRALEILSTRFEQASDRIPSWHLDYEWVLSALICSAPISRDISRQRDSSELPFASIFFTIVSAAAHRTFICDDDVGTLLSQYAKDDLAGMLFARLGELLNPAIYADLRAFSKKIAAEQSNDTPDGIFNQYKDALCQGRWHKLLRDKPALIRAICILVRQWVCSTNIFINALRADRDELKTFLDDSTIYIDNIRSAGSDFHNGGRSVFCIELRSGKKIMYKPKDLSVDASWFNLIKRFNDMRPPSKLFLPAQIAKIDHGWCEYVEYVPCTSPRQVDEYFFRAGCWLALLHCYSGSDIHQENLIAKGAHPVPIDLEMTFQASQEAEIAHDAEDLAFIELMSTVSNSVMMVGLLPAYGRSAEDVIFSVGGLVEHESSDPVVIWEHPGRSDVTPRRELRKIKRTNLPELNGCVIRFGDYADKFIEGFRSTSKFIIDNRAFFLRQLDELFQKLKIRRVIRPTRFYAALISRLMDDRQMTDCLGWSLQAEFVHRFADWEAETDVHWNVYAAERNSLLQFDVPYFFSRSDDPSVYDHCGKALYRSAQSGLDRSRERLSRLSQTEVERQVDVIVQNTRGYHRRRPQGRVRSSRGSKHRFQGALGVKEVDLAFEADRIAALLCKRAVRKGGSASWLSHTTLGDTDFSHVVPVGPDMYTGTAGVAVFLAAHAMVRECGRSAALSLEALASTRRAVKGWNAERFGRSVGLGAATGLGSIIYAFCIISELLGDKSVLESAKEASRLITSAAIRSDESLDVLGGSAGAILGLLRLYEQWKDPEVLKRAEEAGVGLLARIDYPDDPAKQNGTITSQGRLLGMSHGAAGVSLALSRLADHTGNVRFLSGAARAVTFENSMYEPDIGNWPDLRRGAPSRWSAQWCNGSTGIGLARRSLLDNCSCRLRSAHGSLETGALVMIFAKLSQWLGEHGPPRTTASVAVH